MLSSSAGEMARAVREGRVSAEALVQAHLERIAEANPRLHGIVQLRADGAVADAQAVDRDLAEGKDLGPLAGVPFTAKDWLETHDLVCAAGFVERRDYRPKRDATVVARMRAAGAILLGKTNVNDGAPLHPRPSNPYDLDRTPGASSSGEAVSVASGCSPVGLGSDSGGSIRYPAHCCGIAGLKPTSGRVPSTGHFPPIFPLSDPRTQVGPMARSVDDLELVLRVIAGPDWRDPGVVPAPLGRIEEVDLRSARVAFFTAFEGAVASAETAATLEAAARALAAEDVEIEEARPERLEESLPITRQYWRRGESISWSEWRPARETELSGEEVQRSLFEWDRFRRSLLSFMERYDAILCPVAAGPAGPHRPDVPEDFVYTLPFSLSGQPVAVVRAGTSGEGLPIGVQVVARAWREDVALALARVIERGLGGWRPPPGPSGA